MNISNVDWNDYAVCYDALNGLAPYAELQQQVVDAADICPGQKILDVGCGTGNTTSRLLQKSPGAKFFGIDSALEMLQLASRKCQEATFVRGGINEILPFANGQFDTAVCVNVLYTLPDPEFTLREICRVLKQKGKLVLTTPKLGCSEVAIFREHALAAGIEVPQGLDWSDSEKAQVVRKLFSDKKNGEQMLRVLAINKIIAKSAIFNFYLPEELSALLARAGFFIGDIRIAYAQQNHFVVARKE